MEQLLKQEQCMHSPMAVKKNVSQCYQKDRLIPAENRGMYRHGITCEVTIGFADKPDQTAVQDVLCMLVKESVAPA